MQQHSSARLEIFFYHGSTVPQWGQGLLIIGVSRSHTETHHSRQESSVRVISPTQRPLPDKHTTLSTDRHSRRPVGFEPAIPASGNRLALETKKNISLNSVTLFIVQKLLFLNKPITIIKSDVFLANLLLSYCTKMFKCQVKVKVNQYRYRPGVAQRFPGS